MKFSVCIGTSRPTTLKAAIDSIRRQTYADWELIVVGQGEDTMLRPVTEQAAQGDPRVRYLHLHQRGVSRARNAAIAASTGDIIALTDDDCEAQADWLSVLAEYLMAEPEVGLVGGAVIAPPAQHRLANCPHLEPAEALYDPVASGRHAPRGWDWLSSNVAIRREVFEQAGDLDEYLGPGTAFPVADDTDYKLRMEALGITMRSTPRVVVHHTYGTRYGLRALARHSRNYARGNGGLAAKLTLLGDPRGQEWLQQTWRECLVDWVTQRQPQRLPKNLYRLWHFTRAYRQCLRDYRADTARRILYPRETPRMRTQAPTPS